MEIADWRDRIDEIDSQLVVLLNERAKCALGIGRLKRNLDLPVYDPRRENVVLQQVMSLNKGPLTEDAIRRLFERIIDENRRLERIYGALEETSEQHGV